eukprot:TRINITY_DN6853_c0_g1_i4.p1 TRINITY_DN6853_c0_g1~~TRINITY_DN6853_c0_g1_i4.p1  ORF type:complete len:437 (+),score=58.78 TRINITY_DN6853_c0_g1_i4:26-1336(+)
MCHVGHASSVQFVAYLVGVASASPGLWHEAFERSGGSHLWKLDNRCEAKALRASAPLTILFGMEANWETLQQCTAQQTSEPLEIHVLGAAYPFEGRANWSLLAQHIPTHVYSKVRIVLVLGAPDHNDNVPSLVPDEGTPECLIEYVKAEQRGKIKPSDVCKQKGERFEVVCHEGLYQDISEKLPRPDIVVMFSPGLGQLTRRSWDGPLLDVLESNALLLIVDLLQHDQKQDPFALSVGGAAPGGIWDIQHDYVHEEAYMTKVTLDAYGAQSLGSYRNPFVLQSPKLRQGIATTKNAVLQAFRGFRTNSSRPAKPKDHSKQDILLLQGMLRQFADGQELDDDPDPTENIAELNASLMIPASEAWHRAFIHLVQLDCRRILSKRQELKDQDFQPKWTKRQLSTMETLAGSTYDFGVPGVAAMFKDAIQGELRHMVINF